MGRICGRRKLHTKFWWGSHGKGQFGDEENIKVDVRVCTGFSWFRTDFSDRSLQIRQLNSGPIKGG